MGVKKMQGEAMNFTSYNPWPKIYFFFLLLLSSCFSLELCRRNKNEKRWEEFRGKEGFYFSKRKN